MEYREDIVKIENFLFSFQGLPEIPQGRRPALAEVIVFGDPRLAVLSQGGSATSEGPISNMKQSSHRHLVSKIPNNKTSTARFSENTGLKKHYRFQELGAFKPKIIFLIPDEVEGGPGSFVKQIPSRIRLCRPLPRNFLH